MTAQFSMKDQSAQSGAPGAAPEDAFSRCIERLQEIITSETGVLKQGRRLDFDALNQRKTHALLEFIQVSRTARPETLKHAAAQVKHLQKHLSENAQLLERRLQATREITNLIVDHIRESESDGTYSLRWPGMKKK